MHNMRFACLGCPTDEYIQGVERHRRIIKNFFF